MKVIVFTTLDEDYFAVHGTDRESMLKFLLEKELITESTEIIDEEEIPESEWDEKFINIWEDNDHDNEPFQVSIRECLENTPTMIFSNDSDLTE